MARILIIDDDPTLCDMLCRRVRRLSYVADFAVTIENGLRKLSTGHYDVVFLDVRLPDGNGLKFLPKIKSVACRPEVIIMTGLGNPDGAELAISSGAWNYV